MRRQNAPHSPPQVVIDLEKLRHINTGLGRFSLHLAQEVLELSRGRFHPVFLLPSGAKQYFKGGGYTAIPVHALRKEGVQRIVRPIMAPFIRRPRKALWHMTHQASKYFPLDSRCPVLLTIHDLNFLHAAGSGADARQMQRKLRNVQRRVDRAAAIVTVSQFTADDVAKHLDVRGKPVHVVPNGMAPPATASPRRPAFLSEGPFLLTVGNVLPHKNFHVLLGMMEHLTTKRLVVAGKKETPYGAAMEREIVRRRLGGRVIMPGEVTDGDRQWLYEHCEAFLFPSLAEGFGFPVLEAMQCGKPVFVSQATSLPEIGGKLAVYFDCSEAGAMAATFRAGMARVVETPGFSLMAREHAARFTWRSAAQAYGRLYESLAGVRS